MAAALGRIQLGRSNVASPDTNNNNGRMRPAPWPDDNGAREGEAPMFLRLNLRGLQRTQSSPQLLPLLTKHSSTSSSSSRTPCPLERFLDEDEDEDEDEDVAEQRELLVCEFLRRHAQDGTPPGNVVSAPVLEMLERRLGRAPLKRSASAKEVTVKPVPPPSNGSAMPGLAVARLRLSKLALDADEKAGAASLKHKAAQLALMILLEARELASSHELQQVMTVFVSFLGSFSLQADRLEEVFGPRLSHRGALVLQLLVPRQASSIEAAETSALGAGRHGRVWAAGEHRAIKQVSLSAMLKMHKVPRLITEVEILKRLKGGPCAVQLLGFWRHGPDDVFIELERAKYDLVQWRAQHCAEPDFVHASLGILAQVVDALVELERRHVVHYDLRCANVLLREDGTAVLSDFGEAHAILGAGSDGEGAAGSPVLQDPADCFQFHSRGTECIKAPEMLRVCQTGDLAARGDRDRRKRFEHGTSSPADVWAFGCLVYELLVGDYLFDEAQVAWSTFFARLTQQDQLDLELIPEGKRQAFRAALAALPQAAQTLGDNLFEDVLLFVLNPDPRCRPTASQVKQRISLLVSSQLPCD